MRNTLIGLLVAIAIIIGAVWLYNSGDSGPVLQQEVTGPIAETNVSGPKLIIGNPDAKLTIVEYGDFQCPICKRFFEQTEPKLIDTYINTNQVKLEFRVETHIGADSATAGEAAYCANDQGQFKPFHDALFSRQGSLRFSKDNLKAIATELGLSSAAFDSCLDSGKFRQTVIDSNAEAQRRIGGTPTFFIEDQVIVGSQPFSSFKAVIDAKL